MWSALLAAVRQRQVPSLYDGLGPSLLGTAASQGVYFYLYELIKQAFARRALAAGNGGMPLPVSTSLLIAALAGCGNVVATNPIWVLVIRMQTSRVRQPAAGKGADVAPLPAGGAGAGAGGAGGEGERRDSHARAGPPAAPGRAGLLESARELWEEDGLLGFWRGVLPSLLMVVNPTIQYVLLEYLLGRWRERKAGARPRLPVRGPGAKALPLGKGAVPRPSPPGGPPGAARPPALGSLEVFLLSALAKAGATVLTYPMLVVKARLQAARKSRAGVRSVGTLDTILQIGRDEGAQGFFRGIGTKMFQSILAAALLYTLKEDLKASITRLLAGGQERGVGARKAP